MKRAITRAILVLWGATPQLWAQIPPEPLDLGTSLKLAVQNSPRLAELRAKVEENQGRVDEAFVQAYPTLDFSAGYNRVEPDVVANFGGNAVVIQPANNHQLALTLRQAIFTFGRLRWSTSAAELNRRSSQESYRQELEQTFLETARIYFDAQLAARNQEVVEQRLQAQQLQKEQANKLFERGTVARFDVLLADAELSRVEQQLIEVKNNARYALDLLASKVGKPLDRPLQLTDPLPSELAALELQLDAATEQALKKRPEMGVIGWAIEAGESRISAEDASNAPRLDLQSQVVNRNVTGFAPGTQWTTGLVFSVPLFDGGLSDARMKQASKVVEQLRHSKDGLERQIRLEVRELYYLLQNLQEQHRVAQKNVVQAKEAARVAGVRYREGLSTQVELLSAQTSYSEAQFLVYRAERDFQVALARWNRAISAPYPVAIEELKLEAGEIPLSSPPATQENP